MLQLSLDNYMLLLLVFARMSGALLFNPFFGKRNVPAVAKIGLALLASILLTPVLQVPVPVFSSTISFMLSLLKEMLVGYALGLIMNLFLSWVLVAGEIIDMEIGLGMARMYDPVSSVSMPVAGTMFNLMITLIFFSSNGHLTLIRILASSCQLFPPGPGFFDFQSGSYVALMFGDMLVLAMKLAMPVIATELLTEAGMGVLMRVVPQINVFAASLQVKVAIGLAIIILALPAVSRLMDDTMAQLYQRMQESFAVMLSGS